MKEKQLNEIIEKQNFDDYLTIGTPPEDVVVLPIKPLKDDDYSSKFVNGLDLSSMLQTMRRLIENQDQYFSLKDKNCSETVGQILEAGCTKTGLKRIAKTRALGAFGNPQEVANKAARLQTHMYNGTTPGIMDTISGFNPITRVGGVLLKVLVNEQPGIIGFFKKSGAGLAIIPVGILALASFVGRGVLNPLRAFNDCKAIINFAASRDSLLLKGIIPIMALPAALFAIPAAIQYSIDKLITAAKSATKEKTTVKHQEELERQVEKKDTSAKTLASFIKILLTDKKAIPYFTEQAMQQIYDTISQAKVDPKINQQVIKELRKLLEDIQATNDIDGSKLAKLGLPTAKTLNENTMTVNDLFKKLYYCAINRNPSSISIKQEAMISHDSQLLLQYPIHQIPERKPPSVPQKEVQSDKLKKPPIPTRPPPTPPHL